MLFTRQFWITFVWLLVSCFLVFGFVHLMPFHKGEPSSIPDWVSWPFAAAFFGAIVSTYVSQMADALADIVAVKVVRLRNSELHERTDLGQDN